MCVKGKRRFLLAVGRVMPFMDEKTSQMRIGASARYCTEGLLITNHPKGQTESTPEDPSDRKDEDLDEK